MEATPKKRETYNITQGVENDGYDFEVAVISLYSLQLCYNPEIGDFKIAIYDTDLHPFDDIVIDITTNVTEKYSIQLKHVRDGLRLNSGHFMNKGKIALSKFFKFDFSKSEHVILMTNGVVKPELAVEHYEFRVKTAITAIEKCLDTSEEEESHVYEIFDQKSSGQFTLYASQKSNEEIEKTLKQRLKEEFSLDDGGTESTVEQLKNFFQQWKRGQYGLIKLDKQDIKMKIAEILFFENIAPYEPLSQVVPNVKADLLREVFNNFTIIIGRNVSGGMFNSLCYFDFPKEELIEMGNNLLIVTNGSKVGFKEIAVILWRLKKFPLIIEVNDENRNSIIRIITALKEESLSFLLLGNITKEEIAMFEVFENLKDLKNEEQKKTISKEFTLSIQGSENISLKELLHYNESFCNIITTKELLEMLNENFCVGDKKEELPDPYVSRRLLITTIPISSMEQFPNDLFAISSSDGLPKELAEWKIYNFKQYEKIMSRGDSLPRKSIVRVKENQFPTLLNHKNSNVHCLKSIDNEHFMWVYSKEKNIEMQKHLVMSEDRLFKISTGNINIICARPGMGKSTMLHYLKNNCPSGYWTEKVYLDEDYQFFNSNCNSSFKSKVKNCFIEKRRVIFFVYGIDNLEKKSLMKAVQEVKKLASDDFKFWIFSEDHLQETLEKSFQVPSMNIEEFSEEEQRTYIRSRLEEQDTDNKVLTSFKMLKNNDILGAPMHLYMLTEIFKNDPQARSDDVFLLTKIYEYFIKTKYQHYFFKAKVSSELQNQITEDFIYYRNEQYKRAAISCLSSTYFNNLKVKCDRYFINQIGNTRDIIGIISKISNDGRVIFANETYADYFAAIWLADNIKDVEDVENYIFREEFKNIFFMFNLEICKDNAAYIAILYRNYEQLQQNEDKLTEADSFHRSALHLACSYGTKYPKLAEERFKFREKGIVTEDMEVKKIIDYLIGHVTFNPQKKDTLFGWNLIDYAFKVFNLYVIEKILSADTETIPFVSQKLSTLQEDLLTVIYYSVKFEYKNLLLLTAENVSFSKALSMTNCNGESLLHLAVKTGNCHIVTALLNKNADVNVITSNENKRNPLHVAAENNHCVMVSLLLEDNAIIDAMDRYRRTPLHMACNAGAYNSVTLLLANGADVNFQDNFGNTPLHLAATNGHVKIVKFLLEQDVIIKTNRCGNSPIDCAIENKHEEIIELLGGEDATSCGTFSRRLSTNKIDEYMKHPLHWASGDGIEQLLEEGSNINDLDHSGRTPLHKAVVEQRLKDLELLIRKGADINIADNHKIAPLCKAIKNEDEEIVKLLLNQNALVDVKDAFGCTPLHWACLHGNLKILELLLNKNSDTEAIDENGRKPVDYAVDNGHYQAVARLGGEEALAKQVSEFLIHFDRIKNKMNSERLSPFEEAVNSGICSLVEKFLNQKYDFETVIYRAAVKEHRNVIELLLERGADVNASDDYDTSLLHWTAFCGNRQIVELLLKFNVAVNIVDKFGFTPMHIAAMKGHHEILSLLIVGGDVDVVDKCGNTPLGWAWKKGHVESVEVLLKNRLEEDYYLSKAKKQRKFLKLAESY